MNKKEYLNFLQKQVDELEKTYEELEENDFVGRASTLGKINAFLTAKLFALELQENVQ